MSRADRALTQRFWSETPTGVLWPLLVGIFFSFACFGFLIDVGRGGRHPWPALAALVCGSGLIAVAYILIAVRRMFWLFVPVILLELAFARSLDRIWPPAQGQPADTPARRGRARGRARGHERRASRPHAPEHLCDGCST